MNSGIDENALTITFTKKTIFDHIRGVTAKWKKLLIAVITIFGVLTAGIEAFAYFYNAELHDIRLFFFSILFALFGSSIGTIYSYLYDCPEGFENESVTSKRIAQMQRARWEHLLAKQLLLENLRDLDDELTALEEGRVFVLIKRRPNFAEYINWVGVGPNNVLRMVDVVNKLLIHDLPSALASTDEVELTRFR